MIVRKLFSPRAALIGGLLLMLVLLLAAFSIVQGTPEFTDASAPDWSRGKLIGHASLVNPVGLLRDAQGDAHLVWVIGDPSSNQQLNYARLNANGDVVFSQPLALSQPRPESPTLLRAADGTLHLFYLAQSPSLGPLQRALYYARLTNDGKVTWSYALSAETQPVRTYDAFQQNAALGAFYSGDEVAPGLFVRCVLDSAQRNVCPPQLDTRQVNDAGTRPAVVVDATNHMHLAWFQHARQGASFLLNNVELYFATVDAKQPIAAVKVAEFELQAGVDLKPPQIALDPAHVYLAWVQDKRGGRGQIGAQAFYVSFPIGKPTTFDEPIPLALPRTAKVRYESQLGGLLSALAPAHGGSNYVNDLQLLSGQQALGVALLGLQDKGRASVQVATVAFAQGKVAGFQVVNDSLAPSNQPSIALDANRHVQLVWLDNESGDQFAVRYASTDPQLVARWGQLGARDVAARASNFVWYELSFLPWIILSVPWLFVPMVVLIVRTVIGSDESLASRGTRIALALAILVHLAVKVVLLPPLPADWSALARAAFIAALSALGLAAMALYLRRERYASPIVAYLIFAAVDVFTALFVWMPLANG